MISVQPNEPAPEMSKSSEFQGQGWLFDFQSAIEPEILFRKEITA